QAWGCQAWKIRGWKFRGWGGRMVAGGPIAIVAAGGSRLLSVRAGSAAHIARRRARSLLGTTALVGAALVCASPVLSTEQASAACTIGVNTVDCLANTTTTDTTNTNAALTTSIDRHQQFTAGGPVSFNTATVNSAITVNGFGLAITNTQAGANGAI